MGPGHHNLPVAGEIEFLRMHVLVPERFWARETTVNRLLRKIRTAILASRGRRPARQRYFRACHRMNELFDYELTGRYRPLPDREGALRAAPLERGARPLRADPQTDAAGGPHRPEMAPPGVRAGAPTLAERPAPQPL
jgi:hypothetical protein